VAGPDGYIAILTFVTTVLQVRYELDALYQVGVLTPPAMVMPEPG
jgi:hypothetical protein